MVVLPVNSVGMLGGLGAFAILGALATKVRAAAAAQRDVSTYPAACGREARVLCDVPRAHRRANTGAAGRDPASRSRRPPHPVAERGSGGQRPVDRSSTH
jgi:hypothetical protein